MVKSLSVVSSLSGGLHGWWGARSHHGSCHNRLVPGTAKSPGEAALSTYLDHRGLAFRYEPSTSGPNPDYAVEHPICGAVVMDVIEPVFQLPRNPDGSLLHGFLPRA